MKDAVKTYRQAVCRRLCCSPAQKRLLKGALERMLHPLLEENPAPDLDTLYSALGTPEAAASELLTEVSAGQQRRWKYIRRGLIAVCAAVVCAIFVFLLYEAAIRPIELEIVENTTNASAPVNNFDE